MPPPAVTGATKSAALEVGDLDIDLVHHMATLSGKPLQLTAKEFELLAYLARHAGKVCTHHMILKDVWGPGYGAESNYVRVYTHRLRKKLGDEEGRMLKTIPGVGYQLVPATFIPGRRTSRAGCASAARRSNDGVPSATTAIRRQPGHTGTTEEAQDQRTRPVDQDDVGADPGSLERDDRLECHQLSATVAVAPTPRWRWWRTSCLELGQGLVELQHVDVGRAEEAQLHAGWSAG